MLSSSCSSRSTTPVPSQPPEHHPHPCPAPHRPPSRYGLEDLLVPQFVTVPAPGLGLAGLGGFPLEPAFCNKALERAPSSVSPALRVCHLCS